MTETYRVQLDAAGPLTLADDGRTVSGVAVPWDEPGSTSSGVLVFARGSIPTDLDDPLPLLLDHDPTRPIGVVAELVDTPEALRFTATLDETPDADTARVQMRSRSRPGVSVGADVIEADAARDGSTVVRAAALGELSSVVRPAFRTAQIAAARKTTKNKPDPDPDAQSVTDTEGDPMPDTDTAAPAEAAVPDETVPREVRYSTAPSRSIPRSVQAFAAQLATQVRAGAGIDGQQLSRILGVAEHTAVTAALADITTAETPPMGTWLSELDNLVLLGMPTVNALTVRNVDRWPVKVRQVKTWPTHLTYEQTAEKAEIPSSPVEFEWVNLDGTTKVHGDDVSVQDIEDNGEQLLSELFELTAEVIANRINLDALTVLGQTTNVTTDAGAFDDLTALGAAVGQIIAAGGNAPVVLAAGDVFGKYWANTAGGGPAMARLSGLDRAVPIVPDSMVDPGTAYVVDRAAFVTYLNGPTRMRAVEVAKLGVNIALYRRVAFRVRFPERIAKLATA